MLVGACSLFSIVVGEHIEQFELVVPRYYSKYNCFTMRSQIKFREYAQCATYSVCIRAGEYVT
jgi:hypothetical protein